MFEFNPDLGNDEDDEDGETVVIIRRENDDEDDESGGATAIDLTNMDSMYDIEVDETMEGAVGGSNQGAVGGGHDVEIDEQLFAGDDLVDEELFDIDEDELIAQQIALELVTNDMKDLEIDDVEDNESVE
jgi:hypothetical protein